MTATTLDAAAAPPPSEQALLERLKRAETEISGARTSQARIGALKALDRYLDEAVRSLPAANKDEPTRRLRGSLWTLKGLLDKIDTRGFKPEKCEEYRAAIFLDFSPHAGAPQYVPGEAREALKLLALVCDKPGLAEIPVPGSPPGR